jgi:serine/threonine protein kinase
MPISAGAWLGPYEIQAPLGSGGMGEVYRGRDSRLGRTVAIKILPKEAGHEHALERFLREAQALSRLSHPHICTIHDVGEEDGVAFLVMEHLEGDTLAERLGAGALRLDEALRYGHEIAAALDEAHRQGIVHRDLKPGNIMLTRTGAKVLDFGLAKLRQPDSDAGSEVATRSFHLTAQGVVVGTVPYMSPEQLEGRPLDGRTDIFALGIVLYEMVAGVRPFKGDSRGSIMAAILSSDPEPLSTVRPLTPPLLDRVVKRCLAKDPEERWQTARDLAAELKFIHESASQAALPPAKRRAVTWLLAGALLLISGSGLGLVLAPRFLERPLPTIQQLTFRRGTVDWARFTSDGKTVFYSAYWDGRPPEIFSTRLESRESSSRTSGARTERS